MYTIISGQYERMKKVNRIVPFGASFSLATLLGIKRQAVYIKHNNSVILLN